MEFAIHSFDDLYDNVKNTDRVSRRAGLLFRFFEWIRKKMEARAFADFTEIREELEQALSFVQHTQIRQEEAHIAFKSFQKVVRKLTKVDQWYEKADYFESARMKQLMSEVLGLSYAVEAELRICALERKKANNEDSMFNALSSHSQKVLSSKLARD